MIGLACAVGCASPGLAQEAGGAVSVSGAVSVDSAAIIRESLERPPAKPRTDAVDVVQFPFKVALFPLKMVFRSMAAVAGLLTVADAPLPVRAVRDMRAAGIKPRVHAIGHRSGPALDFQLTRFAPFFAESGISLVGSQRHRIGVILGDSTRGPNLLVAAAFRRNGQENFWGIGPDSREEDRSDFEHETWEAMVRGGANLGPLFGRVGVGVETNLVRGGRDGGLPDLQDVFMDDLPFGAEGRTKFLRLALSSTLDLTRRIGLQDRGLKLSGGVEFFRGIDGTESDFHRFSAQVLGYLPVSSSQTLAIRGLMEANDADDGSDIPLFHQVRFGGSRNGPRGFSSGRFRDDTGIALMAEWRYEIWSDIEARNRAEAFLLFDEAVIGSSLSALDASDFRSSYGFGFRLVKRGGLSMMTYVAFSEESTQFAVKTQWPF